MKFTEEMINEDEKRWHARNIVTELGYCGNYMRDRKDMTNMNIRFYAYIMRKAHDMLKEQEAKNPVEREKNGYWIYVCPTCGSRDEEIFREWNYCPFCGRKVKWE